jgi:hypothetical protein
MRDAQLPAGGEQWDRLGFSETALELFLDSWLRAGAGQRANRVDCAVGIVIETQLWKESDERAKPALLDLKVSS